MKYTEVTLHITPIDPFKDILTYSLGEEGPYDSFVDTKDGMKAYVPTDQYDEDFLKAAIEEAGCDITFEVQYLHQVKACHRLVTLSFGQLMLGHIDLCLCCSDF